MAAKRFRTGDHRLFHRDAGYLEGRRVRRSRETRAMARRTEFGKEMIAGQWAGAEFGALGELWALGLPVPYPVQLDGTEMLMEFIGTDDGRGRAPAGRRAAARRTCCRSCSSSAARRCSSWRCRGWAHGDLSPYNVLLHERAAGRSSTGRRSWTSSATRAGPSSSSATATTCARWFVARGLEVDEGLLFGDLMGAATSRW